MRCWDLDHNQTDGYQIIIYELPAWRRAIEWAGSYTPFASRSKLAYRFFTWAVIQAHIHRRREIVVPLDQVVTGGSSVVPRQRPPMGEGPCSPATGT